MLPDDWCVSAVCVPGFPDPFGWGDTSTPLCWVIPQLCVLMDFFNWMGEWKWLIASILTGVLVYFMCLELAVACAALGVVLVGAVVAAIFECLWEHSPDSYGEFFDKCWKTVFSTALGTGAVSILTLLFGFSINLGDPPNPGKELIEMMKTLWDTLFGKREKPEVPSCPVR
ncbi:hypothetical protein ACQP00_32825 [Dactylosporangium sp. CS-047395]|uniref:hypothetical protein n=1 Tax=Dactylosporangium sp. CS-047395 TaxID=3239936 RepID=UPI003D8CDCC0